MSSRGFRRTFARTVKDAGRLVGIRALNRTNYAENTFVFIFFIIAVHELLNSKWDGDDKDEETEDADGRMEEKFWIPPVLRKRVIQLGRGVVQSVLYSRIGTIFLENAILLRKSASAATNATESLILQTRENAAQMLTQSFNRQLNNIMDTVAERVAEEIKDKDMPSFVLETIDETMATVIPDVKREMFRQTSEVRQFYLSPAVHRRGSIKKPLSVRRRLTFDTPGQSAKSPRMLGNVQRQTTNGFRTMRGAQITLRSSQKYSSNEQLDQILEEAANDDEDMVETRRQFHSSCFKCRGDIFPGRKSTLGFLSVGRLKSNLLYTLYPYNQSIWTRMRNPLWWLFTCPAFFPIFSEIWWCFLYLLRDLNDEYQLIDFIVNFQTAKFLTSGVLGTGWGASLYYLCVTDPERDCSTHGPMLTVFGAIMFCIQICLTWIAFLRLPKVNRPRTSYEGMLAIREGHAVAVDGEDYPIPEEYDQRSKELLLNVPKGGHLSKWFWYDTTITLCVFAFMLLAFVTSSDGYFSASWRLRSTLYWIRTIYGLLSLPFALLKLPFMMKVLTHATVTGYDRNGRVVFGVQKKARISYN